MHTARVLALRGTAVLGIGVASLAAWRAPIGHSVSGDGCAQGRHQSYPLAAKVIGRPEAFALPTSLALVGDYLVVLDAASDSVLHVLDRTSGAFVRSLGRRGEGPGEFRGAWSLDPADGADPAVWVWDLELRRLTLVPIAPGSDRNLQHAKLLRIADGAVLTEPRWIGADTIVSPGLMLGARLALYDPDGRRIGGLGAEIEPAAGAPPQALQASLARRPGGRRLAVANRYVSRIELTGPRPERPSIIEGPVSVNGNGRAADLDQLAYVDVAGAREHVVALFSGRRRDDFGPSAAFGSCLQVFDWRGHLEAAYRLDSDLVAIAVEPDGSVVYGLRHEPTPAVVRYDFPVPESAASGRVVAAARRD